MNLSTFIILYLSDLPSSCSGTQPAVRLSDRLERQVLQPRRQTSKTSTEDIPQTQKNRFLRMPEKTGKQWRHSLRVKSGQSSAI